MATPKFEDFIDPVFRLIAEMEPLQRQTLRAEIIKHLNLSEEDQREQVKSGRVAKWKDRANWSVSYLKASVRLRNSIFTQTWLNHFESESVSALRNTHALGII